MLYTIHTDEHNIQHHRTDEHQQKVIVRISDVDKWYGRHHVLHRIDLQLHRGEIVALMGPNGSGKSTLMKCIVGLAKPNSGIITIYNGANSTNDVKSMVGYMPQVARFPESLTVRELFYIMHKLRGKSHDIDLQLYEQLSINMFAHKPLGSLSGGQRQRVNAALAFYFTPSILLLDEPIAGLDPISGEAIKAKIAMGKRQGKCIVMSTHSPQDATDIADRILYIYDGSILIDTSIEDMFRRTQTDNLLRAIATYLQERNVE